MNKFFKLLAVLSIAILSQKANSQLNVGGNTPPVNGATLQVNGNSYITGGNKTVGNDTVGARLVLSTKYSGSAGDSLLMWNPTTKTVGMLRADNLNGNFWGLNGNAGTTSTNFLGTTDPNSGATDNPIRFRVNNDNAGIIQHDYFSGNTALGSLSFTNLSTGAYNVAMGNEAAQNLTTGGRNTAIGSYAMSAFSALTGSFNTGVGSEALVAIDGAATGNTALGARAGQAFSGPATGTYNTFIGYMSGKSFTTASYNAFLGDSSGLVVSTGSSNTLLGQRAGSAITSGSSNIVIGASQGAASATANNQLNIGGAIFGTGLTGNQAAPAGNIGIGTANPQAALDVTSSTSGMLPPRVSLASTTAWNLTYPTAANAVEGTMVYNTNASITSSVAYPATPAGKGLYYWDGTGWVYFHNSAAFPQVVLDATRITNTTITSSSAYTPITIPYDNTITNITTAGTWTAAAGTWKCLQPGLYQITYQISMSTTSNAGNIGIVAGLAKGGAIFKNASSYNVTVQSVAGPYFTITDVVQLATNDIITTYAGVSIGNLYLIGKDFLGNPTNPTSLKIVRLK